MKLNKMIKTKEEIKLIREGGVILAEIMKKISVMIYPGMNTGELEKKANKIMQAIGARPAFKNFVMPNGEKFPTALCTSINHEIVHAPAIPSRILESGDIVGIDVGMEYPYNATRNPRNKYSRGGGYYTDMAQTFLVGDVKPEIKKLVEVTEQSLYLGLEQVKPGNTLNDIGKAIQGYVEKNGFSVVRELVGHGVGYAVHEAPQVPHYAITNKSITKFQSGQKNKEKYLGIDWGEKRIGLAIGERGSNMAIPFDVVGDINSLMKVIKNENINRLIIGNPIKMSGEKNTTKEFEIFIKKLKSILDIPMEFVDERLTSKEADALIGDKRTKAPRDSIAAMLILQQYLDRIS